MSRRSLAILAVALGCGLALGAGQASANHVSCGDEISADTTLDSDLVNCENNGIVIGADDITLDLNGHPIDGDGTEFPGCDPKTELCDFGIANDGHDGVTVRDGSVREFGIGVLVGGARENRVLDISSSSHDFFGAVVGGSSRSVIRGGSFSRNIAPEGDGIGLFGSDHIRIVRNKIRRNPGPGIHVFDSTANLIKGNRFGRNGPALLMEGDRNRVRRNRFIRDEGIIVLGSRNVVARNRLARGSIAVENGSGNLVARNVVVRARGRGISLGLAHPPIGGADNVVRRNLVRGAGRDGFYVAVKDGHSLLKRNTAIGARGDGFDVNSRSATLTRNRAARNGGLGIEAVAGVIDGGGNRAHGNGNPAQCTNVACG
jgi:large repetitive protein